MRLYGKSLKIKAALAQAFLEDYGILFEQGFMSCLYDSEAKHVQMSTRGHLRFRLHVWERRGCKAETIHKRSSTYKHCICTHGQILRPVYHRKAPSWHTPASMLRDFCKVMMSREKDEKGLDSPLNIEHEAFSVDSFNSALCYDN